MRPLWQLRRLHQRKIWAFVRCSSPPQPLFLLIPILRGSTHFLRRLIERCSSRRCVRHARRDRGEGAAGTSREGACAPPCRSRRLQDGRNRLKFIGWVPGVVVVSGRAQIVAWITRAGACIALVVALRTSPRTAVIRAPHQRKVTLCNPSASSGNAFRGVSSGDIGAVKCLLLPYGRPTTESNVSLML